MRILVTGASGFIGRSLVSRLAENHEVFAIIHNQYSAAPNEKVFAVMMDLARELDSSVLPKQIDVIIHLAQANVTFPEAGNELFAVNAGATQQLLDYGRRAAARQFILASTGDVYGRKSGLSNETDAVAPASYYAITKYAAELLLQSYSDYLRPCIIRLYQPYGPGQFARLMPKLADRVRHQRAVRLHKDDRPFLTPIYIDDVTHAIERAIESCYSGIVNIAGDRVVSMRELAEEIGRVLGSEPVFEETGEESADSMGDNNLMKRVLGGWNMAGLSDGLSRMFKGKEAIP